MARDEDLMLTAEERRLRNLKRRRILGIAIGLVLLIVLAVFGGRPTLNAIKSWQARRHASRAFVFLDQQKWTEARDEAVAAYQLRPNEPQALRAVARYLSRTRQQQALEFWKELRTLSEPLTREDRRDEAMIALVSGDTERASGAIDQLLEGEGKNAAPVDWLLAAQCALQKGAPTEAQNDLQKIFGNPKATEREQLQAALLELQAASSSEGEDNKQHRADAWSRINKLAQGKSDIALDALVLLAQRVLSSPTGGTGSVPSTNITDTTERVPPSDLARAIENHPLAKAPQKLVALDLQMHEEPAKKNEIVDLAIAQWKESDAASLAALATWLNGHGEYEKTLDSIPLEKALQARDLLLQHLDALGALNRWEDIRKIIESEKFPLDPVMQKMYLARCYAQLGQKTASENNWQRSLEAAGNDVQKLIGLADYAEKNGALDIAERALNYAAAEMPKLRAAQQGRLRMAQNKRDTVKIHSVLSDMLKTWPNDTAIQNDEAYTRLLLGNRAQRTEDRGQTSVGGTGAVPSKNQKDDTAVVPPSEELEQIEQLAAKLVEREPASLPHRTLLALARLKQGRPVAALEVYSGIQVTPNALSPSALAVHAAVLAANDHKDEARSEMKEVPLDKLLPEEQAGTADLRD